MTSAALLLVGLVAVALVVLRMEPSPEERKHRDLRAPKGWLRVDTVSLEDALDVADRHLPTGRPGANIRLQFGAEGCLTMLRRVDRQRRNQLVLRWEFWRPDPDLAERLLGLPDAEIHRPGRGTLELVFDDNYPRFKEAVETAFGDRDIVTGKTHLTWNC